MKPRKVSVLWSDGSLTYMKSVNALRIAIRWLQIRNDVLMVFADGDGLPDQIYLKEGR